MKKKINVPDPDDPNVLTWEEVSEFLAAIDRTTGKGKRDYAIVRLALECGMRAREFGRIELRNVKYSRNYPKVKHRLKVIQKGGRLHKPMFGEEVKDAFEDWRSVGVKYAKNGH